MLGAVSAYSLPGDEGRECAEGRNERFPGFAFWLVSHGPRGVSRLPDPPAKRQCQPPGHGVLLRAQIRLADLFSCFIFLELEMKIFFSKY